MWIENLLAALVSLRDFAANFHFDHHHPTKGWYLPPITRLSYWAPRLEYFAVFESNFGYSEIG